MNIMKRAPADLCCRLDLHTLENNVLKFLSGNQSNICHGIPSVPNIQTCRFGLPMCWGNVLEEVRRYKQIYLIKQSLVMSNDISSIKGICCERSTSV